jgi:hypothetical protein
MKSAQIPFVSVGEVCGKFPLSCDKCKIADTGQLPLDFSGFRDKIQAVSGNAGLAAYQVNLFHHPEQGVGRYG